MKRAIVRDHSLHATRCPGCGEMLIGALNHPDVRTKPRPGNLTVCAHCGVVGVFAKDMSVRRLGAREIEALPAGDRARLRECMGAVRRARDEGVR